MTVRPAKFKAFDCEGGGTEFNFQSSGFSVMRVGDWWGGVPL